MTRKFKMMEKNCQQTSTTTTFFRLQIPRHTTHNLHIYFFQFMDVYVLSPTENKINVDIWIYLFFLKKETENRSSAPGNKSLHDAGVRRDSEREVLEMRHILLFRIPLVNPTRWNQPNVAPFVLSCSSSPFLAISLSLLATGGAILLGSRSQVGVGSSCISHLARRRGHHARHPTRHSSVGP